MALDPGVVAMVLQQLGGNNGSQQAVVPPGSTPVQTNSGSNVPGKLLNTATGAASGAAMGSTVGPLGTAIGGVLGGIASLFK
jgi:hypothetical protein